MIFSIVKLVCRAVPGHDVVWFIAVPQQHPTFEHFEQTGAAVHPALCSAIMELVLWTSIVHICEALCKWLGRGLGC